MYRVGQRLLVQKVDSYLSNSDVQIAGATEKHEK